MNETVKVAFPDGHVEELHVDRIKQYQARDGRAIFWTSSGRILDLKVGQEEALRIREELGNAWIRQNAERMVDKLLRKKGVRVTEGQRDELFGFVKADIEAAMAARSERVAR